MMTQAATPSLHSWISQVNSHIQARRVERQGLPRPQRNRERERARREARALFRDYYATLEEAALS